MVIRIKIDGEWVDFLKKGAIYSQPNISKILNALKEKERKKNDRKKKRNNR